MNKLIISFLLIILFIVGGSFFYNLYKPQTQKTPEIEKELTKPIKLFFYNKNLDKNQSCDPSFVIPLQRTLPLSKTPIQDAINLLLKGSLTTEEKGKGFTTEFPLDGVSLSGAVIKDGVLTLEFSDPNLKTVGGSCRVILLRSQIEKTALQFPGISRVTILPEELFQP